MDRGSRRPPKAASVAGSAAVTLWLAAAHFATAQVPEYQLKAEFLERFTQFIDWPAESFEPPAPFVIGIYGGNPFGPYLEDLTSQRAIKGRRVQIREVRDASGAGRCHVLFIAGGAKGSLRAILAHTESLPVLTVGDSEGFAEQGVLINFYPVDNRIAFEINDSAARKSGLKLSSKLLKLARIVKLEARQ